jgi:hypothetical protein
MKIKLSAVVICALCALCAGIPLTAHGQSLIGASVPFGLQLHENSGMSLAMGGASSATNADYNLMLKNPALLSAIDKTVLSALFTFDFIQMSDATGHTNMMVAAPEQISVGIPLGRFGTVGLSYDQRTNHAVSAEYDTVISYKYPDSLATYSQGLSENGGISVWQLGYAIQLWKRLQIGASYERAYYAFSKSRVETFAYERSITSSRDSSKTACVFNGLRFGLVAPLAKVRVALSGEYFFSSNAKTDSAVYPFASTVPVPGTADAYTYKLRLPPSLTLGLAYDFSQEWLTAADLSLVFWKSAITGSENTHALYAPSVSLGAQYFPAPNLLTPKYWEIIRYRAGFRFSQLPTFDASEITLSLGTGLPIGRGAGVCDIGVEVGRRSSGTYPNLKENVVRIAVGFDGGRKWSKLSRGNY